MKKILLLLFLLLVTTGCTVNYTLKYENGQFTENVHVTGDNEDDAHQTYQDIVDNGLPADVDSKDYFTLDPSSSRFDVKLSHTLKNAELKNLNSLFECFKLNTVNEDDRVVSVSLYGGFTCNNFENSTFVLETSNDVIDHNANKVDGNKYIWNLDEKSVGENGISFKISKKSLVESKKSSSTIFPLWLKIVIGIVFVGIGIILVAILKKTAINS